MKRFFENLSRVTEAKSAFRKIGEGKTMRKKITIILACLFILIGVPVQAKGNEWILDESEVISSETEDYISNLNEAVFSAYQRKPQLGFMIIDRLPSGYTMDEYKLEQFNLYGVGTKEENCGMLFIFAIQDRKYGLEIGDGFEKGSLLRKELEQDFITSNMKNMLREENYDGVVLQVAKHLENIMADEEHGIYAQRERELKEKEKEFREKDRITNIVLLTIIGVIGLFVLIFKTVCYLIRRRTVKALLEDHQRYVQLIKADPDSLYHYFMKHYNKSMKEDFVPYLHEYFIHKGCEKINAHDYRRFREVNPLENFRNFQIKDVETFREELAVEKQKELRINGENKEKIRRYILQEKTNGIDPQKIESYIIQRIPSGEPLSDTQLKNEFTYAVHELSFRKEYDKFIEQNRDKIQDKYFDSDKFYNSLKNTPNYKNYNYLNSTGLMWIHPLLLSHMNHQKIEVQRREEERQREIEAEREERARRERETRMFYSDFGGGFDGGSSSGGGFSGGW